MLTLADVAVTVSDAKAAANWWEEKLGFAVHTIGEPGGHALMVAPPGERFVLHLCEGFEPTEPGNTGIAFITDDIDGWVTRMVAGGVRFPQPLLRGSGGAMAKFADPDGNVCWLIEAPTGFIRKEAARRAPRATPARRTGPRRTPKPPSRPRSR